MAGVRLFAENDISIRLALYQIETQTATEVDDVMNQISKSNAVFISIIWVEMFF